MGDTRLIHDAAFAGATAPTEAMEPKPAPGERKEFHRQAYQVIKASIEGYAVQKARETARLGPGRN
jgi:hypothetical protein